MKIEYICHACLLIDTGKVKIVTDPWLEGAAYCGQWYVFPKPIDVEKVKHADVILISHGHEDHLHEATLRTIPKDKQVFYPYLWYGAKEYIQSLGFKNVREAITNQTYYLADHTSITYIANNLDSIAVIEHGDEVLVNVNDALHSSESHIIDIFISLIKRRCPRISVVFCGFGGASYFPNTIHCPGKDDVEIGHLREQLFIHNFCRIVHGLQPKVAVPFAADFVLLEPEHRWINSVRFPRTLITKYYETYFANGKNHVTLYDMYPGDKLDNGKLEPASPYRNRIKNGKLDHLIDEQYQAEIDDLKEKTHLREEVAQQLGIKMLDNVKERAKHFNNSILNQIKFCVRVSDVAIKNCYHFTFKEGETRLWRSAEPEPDNLLVIDTRSQILRYALSSVWGGDVFVIGYGCDIHVFDRNTIERKFDEICLQLLIRYPKAIEQILKRPLRTALYLWSNPLVLGMAARRFLDAKDEKPNMYGSNWLLHPKDEIRQTYSLPSIPLNLEATSL